MAQALSLVTYLVRDYDEAIGYFTGVLGFTLLEDTALDAQKRWVRVAPATDRGAALLLARAVTPEQTAHVGNQAGGRVSFFLDTGDFWPYYERLKAAGVRFIQAPRHEPYGWVVVFEDLYGNKWDLVERS